MDTSSRHFYSTLLEVLARAIRVQNEIKAIQTGKEEVNPPLLADTLVYFKTKQSINLRSPIKKTIKISSAKLQDRRPLYRLSIVFVYSCNELKMKVDSSFYNNIKEKKIPRNKLNKRSIKLIL